MHCLATALARLANSGGALNAHPRGRLGKSGHRTTTLNDPPRAFAAALATLLLAAALAGCSTDSVGAPRPVTQAAPKPMTHTEAAKECWMATEHGRHDLPLDQRADIVDKCIKDKMSTAN
jgi:hypothetical protein